jgi:ubiquitin carboxyl-terminal hydrolase 25/28
MAVSKLSEFKKNKQLEEICCKAVRVIASERKSDMLNSWLLTKGDVEVDREFYDAKRYYDIPEGQTDIELAVLESLFHMRVIEDPSCLDEARRHFEVIKDRQSRGNPRGNIQADYTNPVGLTNMGNTCYLNSYLQFFFAVKPMRDLILDFDEFKIDTDDPVFQPKTVDTQLISKGHTIKTQECKLHLLYGEPG